MHWFMRIKNLEEETVIKKDNYKVGITGTCGAT
jgi:hypothetical protein